MKFHDGFENIPISLQQNSELRANIWRIFINLLTLPVTSVAVKDHAHPESSVDSKRGKKLQWAKKGCAVWPRSMFTEKTF